MEHWRRNEPTFYNFLTLDRSKNKGPEVLSNTQTATMSRDTKSDSETFVCEIPAGWKNQTDASGASLEFFILRGNLSLNGESVGASGYIHIPQLCGGGEIKSDNGALALVFWNPNIPAYAYPVTRNRIINTYQKAWSGSDNYSNKKARINRRSYGCSNCIDAQT